MRTWDRLRTQDNFVLCGCQLPSSYVYRLNCWKFWIETMPGRLSLNRTNE
eukprot:m.365382 g.365382  ORF g.365382 m.365382 type:complete len:50 (+) comp31069_c0_seq1:300-449(+)